MFRQIVVALDGSKKSKKAARVGFDLAKFYGGAVTLIHVPHAETAAFVVGAVSGYHAAITKPTFAEIEEAGQKVLDEALKIAADLKFTDVSTQMPHGDAATEILLLADQINADLIISGRRGLSGISSLVLGSTTQRINHLAKCACLSVV
ncbi:UspA domain protein [Sulfitobacter noctilucicola]|uniref:Nucleotide-binding universal stress UspA family protein n=1 Tax=Sulfitobacter noctilucicola TaxID=1342301 RepID=A0A7W6M5D8_9RHOB|nr:universal stress protein [Sulfitobacter noctilucicola]KIN62682.1 UspA domain protein [Sulfitobacter noctilucicola]MBB4172785.1 nucleotide-binding universal stress UspA family protein [Sulfitobacter noctilucicola]